MKKIRLWLLLTTMIMIVFPWLSVTFAKGDHGMAVCFILCCCVFCFGDVKHADFMDCKKHVNKVILQ